MILTSLNSEEILYFSLGVIISITISGAAGDMAIAAFSRNPQGSDGKPDLNPLAHADIFGICTFFLAGFGWPKLRKMEKEQLNNIRLATLVTGAVLIFTNLFIAVTVSTVSDILGSSRVFTVVMFVCATTFTFNLLPIPPLGGAYVLAAMLPEKILEAFISYARLGSIVLIIIAILLRLGYLPVLSNNVQVIVNLIDKYIFSVS